MPSLVAVAFFLPGRAKNLSAPRRKLSPARVRYVLQRSSCSQVDRKYC